MPNKIEPKDAQTITKELASLNVEEGEVRVLDQGIHYWVLSSLASYSAYLKEQIPEFKSLQREPIGDEQENVIRRENLGVFGWNNAIDSVHTILDEEISELTK